MYAPLFCRPAGVDFFAQHVEPVDISFGGLRIYSDEAYAVGAFVRLDVFSAGRAPVAFTGEVMWIKAASREAPARYDIGLAFVELTSEALNLLLPLLERENETDSVVHPAHARARADDSVEVTCDEPVSEVRPIAPEPATVRQGRKIRSKLCEIPVLISGAAHLPAAQLGGRTAFILSLIDGATTVEGILDLSGMPAHETLAVLEELQQRGIVELRSDAR